MMEQERYSILYSSPTGNTKMLAEAIRDALPEEDCDYFGPCKEVESNMLYIGFWTDKGNADAATLKLLETLKNKKIFLFGTAGFGVSEEYFQRILNNVKTSIDASNRRNLQTYTKLFLNFLISSFECSNDSRN